ncbi:hypothetical protein QE152_g29096 [Popillia japonica]|uniref:Uncharacterized protein n=1 Tax=Popillia japonica TaxID=7064 RepID=A0AAW1JIT7_POPJA
MLRTPPRAIASFSRLPLPESPETHTDQACDAPTQNAGPNGGAPAPRGLDLPHSGDDLSDEEIMRQIKHLQSLLEKRNKNKQKPQKNLFGDSSPSDAGSPPGASSVDMDTSYCSTASLVRAVQAGPERKRKGSSSSPASSPARRIKVTAQINYVEPPIDKASTESFPPLKGNPKTNSEQPTQGNPPMVKASNAQAPIDALSGSRVRRFPALPPRPQRAQPITREQPRPEQRIDSMPDRLEKTTNNEKIPPIILRDKTQWASVSNTIKRKGINFAKAQNVTDGIRTSEKGAWASVSNTIKRKGINFAKAQNVTDGIRTSEKGASLQNALSACAGQGTRPPCHLSW